MRLLFMNQKLAYDGTSSYTLDLALSLQREGHQVRICTTGGRLREIFTRLGIQTYLVKFNLLSFRKLLEFLREYNPDLIHIQNRRSADFGTKIATKLHQRYLITVHRLPEGDKADLNHSLLSGVIVANEVIRETLVNDQDVPKSIIRVIPRGVNVDELLPDEGRLVPGPGDPLVPVLGSVGRLTRIKGHDVFLKAARQVLDRGVEAMFAIVGEGEESASLWRLRKELKLEEHVTFSPHIPDRRELYRVFDIVVVPTLRGGVGSAVLEAMSMGKPVVASAVGEILHIVQDGKTGLLVPEGNEQALAERMVELITSPELCRSLGETARKHVVSQFALAPMLKDTLGVYEELLAHLEEEAAGANP
jgi:glycosyltransferase involved in cell wall biosynthesis